ncbi:MAG: site-specific DNA-methyltransferase [Duncaniella sp.]|nr:site-specific DNA-methyltransferase [Duncaniella sp.]
MEKMKMKSGDAVDGNVAKIAALFPQCVTECEEMLMGGGKKLSMKIDWDKLRTELDPDIILDGEERYQFTWPDKRAASRLANTPTDKALRPDVDASKDFWNTENLYIEGDNLDVLKVLRENYLGKIKMIYIDPPYNTGNDFVYNDDFAQGREEFEANSGLFDEDGNQVLDPMQRNTESNGRFHTDWLNMIYPRLKVARDLLSDDGVIFISIDDNEQDNLRKVCDEVFGERNFVALMIWEGAYKNAAQRIGVNHEYVLVFAKNINATPSEWKINKVDVDLVLKEAARLTLLYKNDYKKASEELAGWYRANKAKPVFGNRRFRFIDANGVYKEDDPTAPGGRKFNLINPISGSVIPLRSNRGWRFDQSTFNKLVEQGRISFPTDNTIMVRTYLHETDKVTPQSVFYQAARSASERLGKLIGDIFPFPKDEDIMKSLIEMGSDKDSLILDFFSGSATTAHAVMKLNAEDGGNRKFIMVQLPEVTDEKSEARKAGYENICQIGEERIRRAGEKVKEEAGDKAKDLDVGFRVLKLDSSNMEDVFYTPEDFNEKHLFNSVDNVKPDRTPLDLLFQVLPELGIKLSAKIEEKDVNGKKVFFVDGTYLIATFDMDVNESTVTEIAKMKPQYFVMRDASAANDNVLDNFEQIFRHYSPDTIRKIL